jgi:cob(I)alamin adenosyltransferase
MGHRLSKITTRTGDAGDTGLADGTRRGKDNPRIDALGEVDEINCAIGVLLAEPLPAEVRDVLLDIQHDLFDLGGELSLPGHVLLSEQQIHRVETLIDSFNTKLAPLKEFILPQGTRPAALAHLARTVCRRAERSLVSLSRGERISEASRIYLNRLSDLLFVLARVLNRADDCDEVRWEQGKSH